MRIDLVYGNEPFAKAVTDSYVDREERKGRFPKRIRLSPAATKDGRAIGLCRWE